MLGLSLITLAFLLGGGTVNQIQASPLLPVPNGGTSNAFLPTVQKRAPLLTTIFGIETSQITQAGGLDQIVAADASWIRRNAINWHAVEPTEMARSWSLLSSLENELINARVNGLEPIIIVRSTPVWAQHPDTPGVFCGRINPAKLPAFANFMADVVARYSQAPYFVKYWEIWNEPDVTPAQAEGPSSVFGCWGDESLPNFGGDEYGEMLSHIYPAMKAVDPDAKVMVGGLLLECNPSNPSVCGTPLGNQSAKFLEGIIDRNGNFDGGQFFDGVSFHAYDFYGGLKDRYANGNWDTAWNTTGPVLLAKTQAISDVLSSLGVTGKFLMNTESALLCDFCSDDADFEMTKASYIAQSYAAAIDRNLRATVWFSLFGWRNSGLMETNFTPKPAYTAFMFSRQTLRDSASLGGLTLADISGVGRGFKFDRGDREIWVIWSSDGNTNPITLLPGLPEQVYDAMGTPLGPSNPLNIGSSPVYVIWPSP